MENRKTKQQFTHNINSKHLLTYRKWKRKQNNHKLNYKNNTNNNTNKINKKQLVWLKQTK